MADSGGDIKLGISLNVGQHTKHAWFVVGQRETSEAMGISEIAASASLLAMTHVASRSLSIARIQGLTYHPLIPLREL